MLFPEGLLRDALNITIIVFSVSISNPILYQDVTFILDWLLHLPIGTRLGLPQFEHVVINYNRWSLYSMRSLFILKRVGCFHTRS